MKTSDFSMIATDSISPFAASISAVAKARQAFGAPSPLEDCPSPEFSTEVRKLGLLKRTGLFGNNTKGARIERASSFEDLRDAYRLVHEVYLGTGYINPDSSGVRLRIFETSSDTATFVAKQDGRVVGVLSVVVDSADFGLPSDSAFKPELDRLRAQGLKLCEWTNQAVADDFRKSAVTTELMRCALAHAIRAGYHAGIATVSPSHNGFYDLLECHQVGTERSYSEKVYDPVVAMCMDFDHYRHPYEGKSPAREFVHRFLAESNPYFATVGAWDRRARARFLNPELLERLFVMERNLLAECSSVELDALQVRWGQELFNTVTGQLSLSSEDWGLARGESNSPFAFPTYGAGRGLSNFADTAASLWARIRDQLAPEASQPLAVGS